MGHLILLFLLDMDKSMKQINALVLGCVVLILGACMRNDDEPALPERPISRLYLSMSEFQTDETADPFPNLGVIDPADSATMESGTLYRTAAQGGGAVYFDPALGTVFQGSRIDTSIYVLSVSNRGILSVSGTFGNGLLDAMRGIWYHHPSQNLYIANQTTPSTLYVYHAPLRNRGFREPTHSLSLGDVRPWGICMYEDNLLIARTGENGGVSIYTAVPADTNSTTLQAAATLVVDGAEDIRGIAYSQRADVLALSDHSANKVYIFEQASALFSASGTITPTRVLKGSNTGLAGPIDLSIDDREGSERLYVANAESKAVLRFPLSANGNVRPEASVLLPHAPASIHVDARGRVFEPTD